MQVDQIRWMANGGWQPQEPASLPKDAQLVLVFGATDVLKAGTPLQQVRAAFPQALVFGCSTAGEIFGTRVLDDSLVVTAIRFAHTQVRGGQIAITSAGDSAQVGERLAQSLDPTGLAHVLVLSDGLHVNGSALVQGLTRRLPKDVTVTGGLSGDGGRFQETLVVWDGQPARDAVAVVGLYGERLRVGYGSLGGWDPFGPERLITRSTGNVLFELDGKSALDLYKQYLGEHADGLPATGLLFPLCLRTSERDTGVVRTILGVDERSKSMTFAGDMPQGSYARLMKANFDRLIDGAVGAARTSYQAIGSTKADLALLISCVGRKMVLKQRIEEEVEGVRDVVGKQAALAGFYSYGEISPFTPNAKCELHNQTMTITTLSEA